MRRTAAVLLVLALSVFPVAGLDMGLSFLFNYRVLTAGEVFRLDVKSFSDIAHIGLFVEPPLGRRVGLRIEGAVKFSEIPPEQEATFYN